VTGIPEFIKLLPGMVSNDLKRSYAGNSLGVAWSILIPLINIAVVYIIFVYIFRPDKEEAYDYGTWILCGIIPWIFINEAINKGTKSLSDYSFLISKINFPFEIIPFAKLVLPMATLCLTTVGAVFILDVKLDIYVAQLAYYIFCCLPLLIAICIVTSTLEVFIKDTAYFIQVILQIAFWCTPIIWKPSMLAPQHQWFLLMNPFSYIVNGYRDALILKEWPWEHMSHSLIYWGETCALLILAIWFFSSVKKALADYV
jgi:teichoic acid transport system permease protein